MFRYFIPALAALLLTSCSAIENMRDMTETYVEGDRLHIFGTLNERSVYELERIIDDNPHLKTVVLEDIDGTIDAEFTLQAGLAIREAGLDTYLPYNGFIESGAVDLMCAGVNRTVQRGAHVGVHAWGNNKGLSGADVPRDAEDHIPYLEYFDAVGCGRDFYWYTLAISGPDDTHKMNEAELLRYGVATRIVDR